MFEHEQTLNQFLLQYLDRVVQDIPSERWSDRPAGNGHPAIWVLGHLALCGEWGRQILGTEMRHPEWMPVFGPGSSDDVADPGQFSQEEFMTAIASDYPALAKAAQQADPSLLGEPHGLDLLDGTPITTRAELLAHLLTTHFSFHLAQLSGWRRADGQVALF